VNVPHPISERYAELCQICDDHPIDIPVTTAAKFLGISPESLRCSILQGTAGFGLAWRKLGKQNAGYVIPTLSFYLYVMARPYVQQEA